MVTAWLDGFARDKDAQDAQDAQEKDRTRAQCFRLLVSTDTTRQPLQKSDGQDERPTLTAVLCVLLPRHAYLYLDLEADYYLLIYPPSFFCWHLMWPSRSLHARWACRGETGEGGTTAVRHNRVVSLVHSSSRIDRS